SRTISKRRWSSALHRSWWATACTKVSLLKLSPRSSTGQAYKGTRVTSHCVGLADSTPATRRTSHLSSPPRGLASRPSGDRHENRRNASVTSARPELVSVQKPYEVRT